jgi:tRNA nucleotidyltransferase (CCA-adding enzyme)
LGKSSYCQKETLEHLELCKELFEEIRSEGQCISLRSLAIGGRDLTGLGITPGPVIGRLLQAALEYVLEEPSRNRKEVLVEYIKKQLNNGGAV